MPDARKTPKSFKVNDSHKPKSPQEAMERAGYLGSAILAVCAEFLQASILAFREGTFGLEIKAAASRDITDLEFLSAVKELACVSIFLTVVEQGGDRSPTWLQHLLFMSLRSTDRLKIGKSARDIMLVHQSLSSKEGICRAAALSACQRLGFPGEVGEGAKPLESFLGGNDRYRADLLRFGLTQPVENLKKHLDSMR